MVIHFTVVLHPRTQHRLRGHEGLPIPLRDFGMRLRQMGFQQFSLLRGVLAIAARINSGTFFQ